MTHLSTLTSKKMNCRFGDQAITRLPEGQIMVSYIIEKSSKHQEPHNPQPHQFWCKDGSREQSLQQRSIGQRDSQQRSERILNMYKTINNHKLMRNTRTKQHRERDVKMRTENANGSEHDLHGQEELEEIKMSSFPSNRREEIQRKYPIENEKETDGLLHGRIIQRLFEIVGQIPRYENIFSKEDYLMMMMQSNIKEEEVDSLLKKIESKVLKVIKVAKSEEQKNRNTVIELKNLIKLVKSEICEECGERITEKMTETAQGVGKSIKRKKPVLHKKTPCKDDDDDDKDHYHHQLESHTNQKRVKRQETSNSISKDCMPPPPLRGQQKKWSHSNFTFEKTIGSGTFGVVSLATEKASGLKYAIKKVTFKNC